MDDREPMAPPAAYVNFLKVASQSTEIFLSFGQLAGTGDTAHLVAALVTSPAHAKAMSEALAAAVARHEEQFGTIAAPEGADREAAPAASPPRAAPRVRRARKAAK